MLRKCALDYPVKLTQYYTVFLERPVAEAPYHTLTIDTHSSAQSLHTWHCAGDLSNGTLTLSTVTTTEYAMAARAKPQCKRIYLRTSRVRSPKHSSGNMCRRYARLDIVVAVIRLTKLVDYGAARRGWQECSGGLRALRARRELCYAAGEGGRVRIPRPPSSMARLLYAHHWAVLRINLRGTAGVSLRRRAGRDSAKNAARVGRPQEEPVLGGA